MHAGLLFVRIMPKLAAAIYKISDKKLMKKGFLDARTSRTALGIRQPIRRLFAISGTVATGVRLGTEGQMETVLDVLTKLPEAGAVVKLLGTSYGLQAWFRGPRSLGKKGFGFISNRERRGKKARNVRWGEVGFEPRTFG